MDLAARRAVDLAHLKASLADELSSWRTRSAEGQPLEKHHSQVAAITDRLFGLLEMLIFLGILIVGYIWIWQKGALEWV